jgi:hypothetical protein
MRAARTLVAGLFLGAALLAWPPSGPAPARAADEGISETAATTYRLLPEKGLIRVTIDLRVVNRRPDRTESAPCPGNVAGTCSRIVRYFVDRSTLAVEEEARSVRATVDGRPAAVRLGTPTGGYRIAGVDLPATYFGQSRRVRLTYDIRGGKPRSASWIRAGRAYASFCIVANGPDGGSVRAIVPAAYEVSTTGAELRRIVSGDEVEYRSGSLADPYDFWACLEGVNPDGALRTPVAVDGLAVELASWPEDPAWRAKVQDTVEEAIPALERLTGFSFVERRREIELREVAQQQLGDYAGWFGSEGIRLSEYYDPATIAHELSHIWFNDTLFAETWLAEGHAGYVEAASGLAPASACGDPGPPPAGTEAALRSWQYLTPRSTDEDRAVVEFDYAASCWVVSRVVAAIGPDRFRAVLDAARRGIRLYPDADTPAAGRIDWRRWLDLVDVLGFEPGGGDAGLAADLLVRFGVATDADELVRRAAARARYLEVRGAAGDWALPPVIDRAMAAWDFGPATEALDAAAAVLVATDVARRRAGDLELSEEAVRAVFEAARSADQLDGAAALAGRQGDVAAEVLAARAAVGAERDLETEVGLLGEAEPGALVGRAVDSLARGDADAASNLAGQARDALVAAAARGRERLTAAVVAGVVGAVLLVVLLVGMAAIVVRRRHGRGSVSMAGGDRLSGHSPAGDEEQGGLR